jgi:hypothetical protein
VHFILQSNPMVNKCSAVGCVSGYNEKEIGITFHKFPLGNPDLLAKWLRRLSRENFQPTQYSRLCSKHFIKTDYEECRQDTNTSRKRCRGDLKLRYLKPDAVPSIFPNCPFYLSQTSTPSRSSAASSSSRYLVMEVRQDELNEEFINEDKIGDLTELSYKYSLCETKLKDYTMHKHVNYTCFLLLNLDPIVPSITASVKITEDLHAHASVNGVPISESILKPFISNGKVSHLSELLNLLCFIRSYQSGDLQDRWKWVNLAQCCLEYHVTEIQDTDDILLRQILFIVEQLTLMKMSPHSRRFSSSLITLAYLVFSTSATCYDTLYEQNILCLPSKRTLVRVSQKLDTSKDSSNTSYFHLRLSRLNPFEAMVVLLIDEIYISGKVEYSRSGEIVGLCDGGNAKTVLCFMVSSVAGSYRDIVRMVPINRLTTEKLHSNFIEVLHFLHEVGFTVVAICTDNHPVNRAFYKTSLCNGDLQVSIPHPFKPNSPLFLLFDSTHNVKNVFNNFERRRIFTCPPLPHSVSSSTTEQPTAFTANFQHVEDLFVLEKDKPVKAAHKLTKATFNPTSIQKTSVKFAAAVFHESTQAALDLYSTSDEREDWKLTSKFIRLIVKVWNIINVKTPAKGHHKRDISRDPITSPTDWKLNF